MMVLVRLLICVLVLTGSSLVLAHATIVLGRLASTPTTPQPGEVFELNLEMLDPSQVPIEDAVVFADYSMALVDTVRATFIESDTPGVYTASLSLPRAGTYQLLMRDQTYRQEEATATLEFHVSEPLNEASIPFVFPPTATGSAGFRTWLIALIVIPIAVGIVVTIVVLRNTEATESSQ